MMWKSLGRWLAKYLLPVVTEQVVKKASEEKTPPPPSRFNQKYGKKVQ